jgi:hypothetical protein
MLQGCHMVYLQTKNPNLGRFWRALDWKMFTYLFYGHLEYFINAGYFMTIWYIFCLHWVHFSSFGTMYPEKSGNPALLLYFRA